MNITVFEKGDSVAHGKIKEDTQEAIRAWIERYNQMVTADFTLTTVDKGEYIMDDSDKKQYVVQIRGGR